MTSGYFPRLNYDTAASFLGKTRTKQVFPFTISNEYSYTNFMNSVYRNPFKKALVKSFVCKYNAEMKKKKLPKISCALRKRNYKTNEVFLEFPSCQKSFVSSKSFLFKQSFNSTRVPLQNEFLKSNMKKNISASMLY